MNPMVQQSFESASSKRLKRQDSRLSQAVMAAVACGGKIGACTYTCGRKRRTRSSSSNKGSTSTLQGKDNQMRSPSLLSGPKIRKTYFEASNRKMLIHRPP